MGEIKDFIEYIIKYKENMDELDKLDRDCDILKTEKSRIKTAKEELEREVNYLRDRQYENLETIKEQRKKIRQLNKRNKKLQQIEEMFENKRVVLRDLKELVKGE